MNDHPYRRAGELQGRLAAAAAGVDQVLGRDEARARDADRDELRVLVAELAAAARDFEALLDWADSPRRRPGCAPRSTGPAGASSAPTRPPARPWPSARTRPRWASRWPCSCTPPR